MGVSFRDEGVQPMRLSRDPIVSGVAIAMASPIALQLGVISEGGR
jgi:hypothetical protein